MTHTSFSCFDEEDETLDGNEIVFIDYILLLGHWDNITSTIGLYDSNAGPLVNVSMAFTSNDNHATTSDYMRFEIDLIDVSLAQQLLDMYTNKQHHHQAPPHKSFYHQVKK